MSERTDPRWGRQYGEGPHYVTPEGTLVWMHRRGQRVRFFNAEGAQVGPEHRNVAPALVWKAVAGWIDPRDPMTSAVLNAGIRAEVAR
jgi:hypothetical protein